MPNFQGAVNQVFDQAGLYASLAGGPQDLKERIKLGKEEKINTNQLLNVGRDISETGKLVERAKDSGDYTSARELSKKVAEQGKELSRLSENNLDIRERQYQLNPSKRNYEALMNARRRDSSLKEKQKLSMDRMNEQAEAKMSQHDNIRKHIEGLPLSLGGKVKDLDDEFREQVIQKYMEASNGKQK